MGSTGVDDAKDSGPPLQRRCDYLHTAMKRYASNEENFEPSRSGSQHAL